MAAWRYDASEINPDEIPQTYIFKNEQIAEYLAPSAHERKLFLIGPKGCGKTLLLRYKAYLYWQKQNADPEAKYTVNASKDLVESLNFPLISYSEGTMKELRKINTWTQIWNFSILLLILRRTKIGMPKGLEWIDERFEGLNSLSLIVTEIINESKEFIFSRFFANINRMMGRLGELKHSFILFVDRLDQALNEFLTSEEYGYLLKEDKELIYDIWCNAQYAMLSVSYNLTTSHNRHVKIFATAREDAMMVDSQIAINISNYSVRLNYLPDELQEIFERNIRDTPDEELWGSSLDSPLKRFLGFEELEHMHARDEAGNFRKENAFQFILRHTFNRPREVVMIGRRIHEAINGHRRFRQNANQNHREIIRREVTRLSWYEILNSYKNEFVPSFRDDYLQTCLKSFSGNVIDHTEMQNMDKAACNYLYRTGLLGYVERNTQWFEPSGKYMHNEEVKLPRSPYYMLHPCLDRELQHERDFEEFYNSTNIIGHGYPFYPPTVYIPTVSGAFSPQYFLPDGLPGQEKWETNRIHLDPARLYEKIFFTTTHPELTQKWQARIKSAFQALTLAGYIRAIDYLERTHNGIFTEWRKKLNGQLSDLKGDTAYQTRINDDSPEGVELFANRLFGRILSLGALSFLNFNIVETYSLVNSMQVVRSAPSVQSDTAAKYLRTSFFIASLPGSGTLAPHEVDHLLREASDYERDYLRKWWRDFTLHKLLPNGHFSDAQCQQLKSHFNIDVPL